MNKIELPNGNSELNGAAKLMPRPESDTKKNEVVSSPRLSPAAFKHIPVTVSQKQYEAVETAHMKSIALIDSCGDALLSAMESTIPPKDENGNYVRGIGEYTGANIRQLAKSVCDLVNVKTSVVRSIYQIARDE